MDTSPFEQGERLTAHSAVRLYPPEMEGSHWVALHLLTKERYQLSINAAFILIVFFDGEAISVCMEKTKVDLNLDADYTLRIVEMLRQEQLLVDEDDISHLHCQKLSETWNAAGWVESLDYHLLTYDYPFLDYDSKDAWMQDVERMEQYRKDEKEPSRCKPIRGEHDPRWHCMEIFDALSSITLTPKDLYEGVLPRSNLTLTILGQICSVSLGKLRHRLVPNHPDIEPFIRKTSPSGGARHPTEGFVISLHIPDLESGVYEYSVTENALIRLCVLSGESQLFEPFEGLYRAPFKPRAFIILTSIFERNMYRYREPRTFRTIFMDAGHVAATIEIVSASLGIRSFVQHGINDRWFEEFVGLNLLEEGVILGIALG